jgi:hypothetical protein
MGHFFSHRTLGLSLALALLLIGVASAPALAVSYANDGPAQKASHSEGGILVTGSGLLNFSGGILAVAGGLSDTTVDHVEYLSFTAEGPNLFSGFSIVGGGKGNTNGGEMDSFEIEGFNAAGASVGVFNYQGSGLFFAPFFDDHVARLGAGPLKTIRVKAAGDVYWIEGAGGSFVPIPEPSATATLLLAAVLSARRYRNRQVL